MGGTGTGKMAQWLRALILQGKWIWFPAPSSSSSLLPIAAVLGDGMYHTPEGATPFSGSHGHM